MIGTSTYDILSSILPFYLCGVIYAVILIAFDAVFSFVACFLRKYVIALKGMTQKSMSYAAIIKDMEYKGNIPAVLLCVYLIVCSLGYAVLVYAFLDGVLRYVSIIALLIGIFTVKKIFSSTIIIISKFATIIIITPFFYLATLTVLLFRTALKQIKRSARSIRRRVLNQKIHKIRGK